LNRTQGYRFPFQDAFQHFVINPVTNWSRFINPQFFISYNSSDVEVENHVLEQVGSYGKQLGTMQDALTVLIGRLPMEELTPRERRIVEDFQDMTRRVKAAVADYRPGQDEGITAADVDRLLDGLESLARTDPEAHRRILTRLTERTNGGESGADGSAGR